MLLPTILAGGLYLAGSVKLAKRRKAVEALPLCCGVIAFGVLVFLALPWMHHLAEDLFTFHMIGHILLAAVAAPLLIVARPLALMLWAFPRPLRKQLGRLLRHLAPRRMIAALTAPILAVTLHALALWAWHMPRLYEAALDSSLVHMLQHGSLFVTALAFWVAALDKKQSAMAILLLFVTLTHTGILGALLTVSPQTWYHAHAAARWGLTPLEDQQIAGLVMWVPASFLYLAAALRAGLNLLREPEGTLAEWRA